MRVYQNYHRHSNLTNPLVPDSTVTNEMYAKRAVELGHGILSSCEHGYQGNPFECYDLAKQYGLTYAFVVEAYWVNDRYEKDRTNCHIILAARNENGRQAINDILSEANITGFYGRARVDKQLLLSLPPEDVIVTTACVAFWKYADIEDFVQDLAWHFGKNFFLEVQYHNTPSQIELNRRILQLSEEYGISIIMGCDSHYIDSEGDELRDNFLASKNMFYEDEVGWELDYPDGDEAYRRFVVQGVLTPEQIESAMQNTNVFLEIEEYTSPVFNKEIKMINAYPDLTQEERNQKYLDLLWSEWEKYKPSVPQERWEEYQREIQYEASEVLKGNAADYFLANHAIIRQGVANGGVITPTGRGSAVSFFTNRLLNFTKVDRIAAPVTMYPERFLTAERLSVSLPDIDFNVSVVAPFALAQKQVLGEDHAYPMVAYGTQKASAAWKMYARSQQLPFDVANEVSDQLKRYEKALHHADDEERDFIDIADYITDGRYRAMYEESKKYQGIITDIKIAPCSYLLYQGSIRKEIGLIKVKEHLCCVLDGHVAEVNRLLKNDLLKVSVVDLISRVFTKIGVREIPSIDELRVMCPPEDKAWDMYAKGLCLGLNQVEQKGATHMVSLYKPKRIDELCAFVAAIRPGAASIREIFLSRKPFSYGVPSFDNLIQTPEMPYSFIMFQEQAMKTLHYAGIPMTKCYAAIKNIAKKRAQKVLAYKEVFLIGFSEKIQTEEWRSKDEADAVAAKCWQIIEDASGYGFNSSHAYCVAGDSLYTAYLKAHHPLEFYSCFLQICEEKGEKDRMAAIKEEAKNFFGIQFPNFQYGQDNREIHAVAEDNSIVNALTSLKGFSKSIGEGLYECSREHKEYFVDILDYCKQHNVSLAKVKELASTNYYFNQYGDYTLLSRLFDVFELFSEGYAKTIKKDKLGMLLDIALKYGRGTTAAGKESNAVTFTSTEYEQLKKVSMDANKKLKAYIKEYGEEACGLKVDADTAAQAKDECLKQHVMQCLREIEIFYRNHITQTLSKRAQIQNQFDVLGEIIPSNKQEDRRYLYVVSVTKATKLEAGQKVQWGWRILAKSLGTGNTADLILTMPIYNLEPINVGDIIFADTMHKNQRGYWYLDQYHHIYD